MWARPQANWLVRSEHLPGRLAPARTSAAELVPTTGAPTQERPRRPRDRQRASCASLLSLTVLRGWRLGRRAPAVLGSEGAAACSPHDCQLMCLGSDEPNDLWIRPRQVDR